MKKFLSLFLSICIVTSLIIPAYAIDNQKTMADQKLESNEFVQTYYDTNIDISCIPEIMNDAEIDTSIYADRLEELETDLNTVALQNKDGSCSLYLFSEPVKYIDEAGYVRDRSTSLQRTADGAYAVTDNSVKVYYPKSLGIDPLVLKYEANSISVIPVIDNIQGNISVSGVTSQVVETNVRKSFEKNLQKEQLVYSDIFGSGTEVRYTPLLNGYKEDIVLYDLPNNNRFSFLVDAGNYSLEMVDGIITFVDPNTGSVIAQMSPIYLYDSAPMPNESFDSYYEVEKKENGMYVVSIVADKDFLNAASTKYPVYIDPTITFNLNTSTQEAIIYSGLPSTAHGGNYYNFIGYYDNTYKVGRLLVKLPGLSSNSTYTGLKSSELNSVTYYMYCDGTKNSATIRPYIYTGAVWSETAVTYNTATWNGYVALSGMNAVTVPNSAGDVAFNITSAAKAWKDGTYSISKGLIFKNSNESSASYCKTFTSTEYGYRYGTHMPYVVVNYTKFSQSIANLRLYSSERAPGKDEAGNTARDMTYNDKTRPQLYALSLAAGSEAALYDMPPASSSVLPPQGPEEVIRHMTDLAFEFTLGDSEMGAVATSMFEHFVDGSGTDFRNSTLTQKVKNHSSTQSFVTNVQNIVTEYIKNNGGDIRSFYTKESFKQDMRSVPRPAFSSPDDMLNGLKICINDTWGYYVNITNYYSNGSTYRGTLHFTIYDHFGLDDNDVEKFGWTQGFSAWYTLQHYTGCNGAYKPFITYIEFDIPISGTI